MKPHQELINVLSKAYEPCNNFDLCNEAKWKPSKGHIPRGFLGGLGTLEEINLVLVFAEPGHPMADSDEIYPDYLSPEEYIDLCTDFAFRCFDLEVDVMHRNVKYILNKIWPDLPFIDQLKKVWLTETRLCSIDDEIGNIALNDRKICSKNYLLQQIALFPEAVVIGFGAKAQSTLKSLRIDHLKAWSVSPPGANNPKAKDSWDEVILYIEQIK